MKNNNEWIALIHQSSEKIMKEGREAYRQAMENPTLRYIVEMDDDGTVGYWYDVAGGNSFHCTVHDGTAIELLHFCCSGWEYQCNEDIETELHDSGRDDILEEIRKKAEEERSDLEYVIVNFFPYVCDVVEKCRNSYINSMCEEFADEDIEEQLRKLECDLERMS